MYNRPGFNDRSFRSLNSTTADDDKENMSQFSGYTSGSQIPDKLALNRAIQGYEKKFIDYLVSMHNALGRPQISIEEVKSVSELLQHMKKEQTDEYYEALVRPEMSRGAKIPSTIPVPSSSFQLHSQTVVTPNASGNAFIVFNPFYLQTSAAVPIVQSTSTFYVNNNAGVTGASTAPAGTTLAVAMGQTIPPVYNSYRVVSASIVVKYIGRLDIVQGVIGGAVIFDPNVGVTNTGSANANLDKYGDFNLAMDSYYTQENLTLNGIRELFFPLDINYEQYQNPGTAKNGFAFLIYIQDGVPSAANYKVDVYINYEALPDAAFLNYIPQSSCAPMDPARKEEAVRIVQQQPITDSEAARYAANKSSSPTFWERLKSGLGSILPGIASLAATFIPGGKAIAPIINTLSQGSRVLNNGNKSGSFLALGSPEDFIG